MQIDRYLYPTYRVPLQVFVVVFVCACFVGCHNEQKIVRRSTDQLYQEAIAHAAARPPIIQPALHRGAERTGPQTLRHTPTYEVEPSEELLELPAPENLPLPPPLAQDGDEVELPVQAARLRGADIEQRAIVEASLSDLNEPEPAESYVRQTGFTQVRLTENTKITETFDETDVRQAIQILAEYSNASVVVDDTVGGVTSAQIVDESFEQALEKILLPLGLVFARQGDRYLVAPPDPSSPLFSYIATRTQYQPLYHDISTLTNLLPPRHKPFIQVSIDRNMAVIDAPQAIGQEILSRLEELDRPVPQIELEAIVCVVSPESSFRFGLDWGRSLGSAETNGGTFDVGMQSLAFSGSANGQGLNNVFSDFAVTSAFVRLLAQEGYITIRAAPRVTARDGQKALISINRETFFSLQSSSSNVLFQQNVQKVEAGISLEITPRVHGDVVSVLISKAEVSEDIRGNSVDSSANSFPIINRRVVSTDVNVRDGHTIVIGGLVQRQTVDRVNRIPVLSDIPLMGKLFQSIEKLDQEAEVAIFISPRIVPAELCLIR